MEHSLTNIPLSLWQVISQDYKFFHMPCPFRSWLSTISYSLWPLMFVPLPNLPHFYHSFTQPHHTGGLLPFVSWYALNVIELIKKKNQGVKILFFLILYRNQCLPKLSYLTTNKTAFVKKKNMYCRVYCKQQISNIPKKVSNIPY